MRHLLLLIVLAVAGYGVWCFLDPAERASAARYITRHALRLGAVVLVLLALLALAYYVPSNKLL